MLRDGFEDKFVQNKMVKRFSYWDRENKRYTLVDQSAKPTGREDDHKLEKKFSMINLYLKNVRYNILRGDAVSELPTFRESGVTDQTVHF